MTARHPNFVPILTGATYGTAEGGKTDHYTFSAREGKVPSHGYYLGRVKVDLAEMFSAIAAEESDENYATGEALRAAFSPLLNAADTFTFDTNQTL